MKIAKELLKSATTFKTLLIVWILLSVKYFLISSNWLEFVSVNPFLTSFTAGIIFIYWFMLSGTIKEYRESLDIPYKVRMYLDSILRDGILLKKMYEKFDYEELRKIILDFVLSYNKEILLSEAKMDCLTYLYKLDSVFININKLWLPSNFITTMKSKKFEVKKLVIEWYEIKKQEYMPLLSQLQYTTTVILIFLMLFLQTDNIVQDYIVIGWFMFIFIFLIFTVEVMDNPLSRKNYDMLENMNNLLTFEKLLESNTL